MPKKKPPHQDTQEGLIRVSPVALIVTGNQIEADLCRKIGKEWGCELMVCRDYWQAGWELTRRSYDLALIDIDLDPVLGLEWLSRLHALDPGLSIISLTGDGSREREIAARNRGIAFYFVRPAEARDLASIFEHVARKKNGARQKTAQAGDRTTGTKTSVEYGNGGGSWGVGTERRTGFDRRRNTAN